MSSRIEEVLRELGYDLNPKKKETFREEFDKIPRRPEGYESLISDEEFKAIENIAKAVEDFIAVHNKNTVENVDKVMKATPYARIQYTALSDMVRDLIESVGAVYNIHRMDKKTIDESMYECGERDIEKFERGLARATLMKQMLD